MNNHVNGAPSANGKVCKSHPLDPLSANEIAAVRGAVINHFKDAASCCGKPPRFSFITLREPSHLSEQPADQRLADVVVYLPPVLPRALVVQLPVAKSSEAESDVASVRSDEVLPHGTHPVLTPSDCDLAESIVRADSTVIKLLKEHFGITDASRVVCDPWSVHLADATAVPERRLVNTFLYVKDHRGDPGEHNHYASPLPVTPTVDLVSRSVVDIHGEDTLPKRNKYIEDDSKSSYPSNRVDYFENALKYNTQGPTRLRTDDALRPLHINQPCGPTFSLEGRELFWQQWSLHLGFNHREGLVLNNLSFAGRSVMRRLALVEMAVPYADRHLPFPQKCAFDVGDYGLGYCTNSLNNGCDCLGGIRYLDATLSDADGNPYTIENAICIHEEDAGLLHKHVEYRTGKSFVRRARKLVLSFIATVVNYEYLFYWWLHVDGSMGLEIRLSGELSTNTLSPGEGDGPPDHGILVAPGVNAQLHQHMFCARIDTAVDGPNNRVTELNTVPASRDGADKFGNAFAVEPTLLQSEQEAQRNCAFGRVWRISNNSVINKISKKPVGYKLIPSTIAGPQPALLTHVDSVVSKRARFAERGLWVTPWTEGQRFPAGEFPTQGIGESDTGLPEWTAENRDVVDKPLVLWHAFGITHLPRPEDFPIMPCEMVGFTLKPDSFFETNPALDICFAQGANTACGGTNIFG